MEPEGSDPKVMQSILEGFEDVEVVGTVEHSKQYHLHPSLELFLLKHLFPTARNFLHRVKKTLHSQ